jgi:cytolysin (calcineurin-like family phosphatase)
MKRQWHLWLRGALFVLGIAWLAGASGAIPQDGAASETITYFAFGDPQINIPRWGTAGTEKTIEIMNKLPGEAHPLGGVVEEPRAVVILGDLQDDVKNPDNWSLYKQFFNVNGREAKLRFRVFEGLGNHDLSTTQAFGEFNDLQKDFIQRNLSREGTDFHYDTNHYHYSWDWGPLHLVQLNAFPGNEARPVYDREAPWNDPKHSLDFLQEDLKRNVGESGRPVILMWHYGLRGWGLEKWWTLADLANLKAAIAPYNIVLILHGHEHAYARYQWEGRDVLMAPSPQYDRDPAKPEEASRPKGFLVIRLAGDELQVAHHTADGWRETWEKKIGLGEAIPVGAGVR